MLCDIRPFTYRNLPILCKIKILSALRLPARRTLQMPSPLPSPPGTFHMPWPLAPVAEGVCAQHWEAGGAGLLLLVPRDRWGVWLNVMIVTDFLVKCAQETAHPSGSSRRLALGSLAANAAIWPVGTRLLLQPSISPLSSAQDFCAEASDTAVLPRFPPAKIPLSLILTPRNLQLLAPH